MTLLLNLDNFECDLLVKSTPEVLNSPRSLEACATLSIQPVELVYRSLKEYEKGLKDLPFSQILQIFLFEEEERHEKLLRCRELRNRMISEASGRKMRATTAMVQNEGHRRVQDFGGSDSEVNYGSDTESHEDYYWRSAEEEQKRPKSQQKHNTQVKPIHKKFKSNSNLDFKKLISSPRHLCSCQVHLDDDEIYNDYMQRYSDLIKSKNDLFSDDQRILERLVLRKGKEEEWLKKSQELRKVIEDTKQAEILKKQSQSQSWAEHLAEKRRLANIENENRYKRLEEKAKERHANLLKYLEMRDLKVQQYLDHFEYQKQKQLIERHKNEALRQLEVGKTVEQILEADRQKRYDLADRLERRMCESEMRRKRKEMENLRHIAEMNRLEEINRQLKHERLEQQARECSEALRNQLEQKEHRATANYLTNIRKRDALISQGAGNRNFALEKTQLNHKELLRDLENWNKKVFQLHMEAQQRANLNHCTEVNRRRTRVATNRILREERSLEIQRRVKELQDQRMELMRNAIESKDFRSERLKQQKEKQMHISRLRAQHGAELREALREKLDPETFDKKAARAEIEYRLFKKFPPKPIPLRSGLQRSAIDSGQGHGCRCGCYARNGAPQLRNRTIPAHICRQKICNGSNPTSTERTTKI